MTELKLYWIYGESDDVLFNRIDSLGGWPLNAKSLVYQRGLYNNHQRPCYFSSLLDVRDGWNTSIKTADDYYKWKLSPDAINGIKECAVSDFKQKIAGLR